MKQADSLLKSWEEDEVNRENKGASRRFEEITEEDRKIEKRLRVEKIIEADKIVDEMFKAVIL